MSHLERSSLASQVEMTIRGWILDGTLRQEVLYSVQQMAERLQMSRSPVREGLLALAEAGLITFTRNRGFRLVVPRARDVAEIFALRLALEPMAARRAAEERSVELVQRLDGLYARMDQAATAGDEAAFAEADQRLHAAVLEGAGNARVVRIIADVRDATRVLGATTLHRSRTLVDILAEHLPFVDAIRDGDPARAQMSMRRHLISTGRLLITQRYADGDVDAWRTWDRLVDEDG